ncbi:MAG: hypothetical protein A2202_04670 [Bdellovibrionales bacterium RIFOXYA1_FULL_36_14]|nr:MAG: hypothetical protein A2202_04670 [Bdellovibrionales bacterium RIFOXYA1_FULL_36_14]
MKISTKGRYALRAMVELAKIKGQKKITLKEIAKGQDLSIKYLASLLVKLQDKKLVNSYKGKLGGYELGKDANKISIEEIFEAVEGPIDLVFCIDQPGNCLKSSDCKAREIWSKIGKDLKDVFKKYYLSDLV